MVNNIKIAALGGDRRQIYALECLANENRRISVFGIPKETAELIYANRDKKEELNKIEFTDNVEDALRDASLIILPFPSSTDGVRVSCPLCNTADQEHSSAYKDLKLNTVTKTADRDALIVGGKLPLPFVLSARDEKRRVVDLLEYDPFEIKNAYITAEAALSVAMNVLPKSICGARIAVTGFGRISKHLCRLLSLLGASVTVCARRDSDLAFAETLGYKTVRIYKDRWCDPLSDGYDVIYNTVPSKIFDRAFLGRVSKKTLLIELASSPGGFDVCAAQEFGSNLSWALSLPGKYAPESAGRLIAECVESLLSKEVGELC